MKNIIIQPVPGVNTLNRLVELLNKKTGVKWIIEGKAGIDPHISLRTDKAFTTAAEVIFAVNAMARCLPNITAWSCANGTGEQASYNILVSVAAFNQEDFKQLEQAPSIKDAFKGAKANQSCVIL